MNRISKTLDSSNDIANMSFVRVRIMYTGHTRVRHPFNVLATAFHSSRDR
jgi:hypothetical protein